MVSRYNLENVPYPFSRQIFHNFVSIDADIPELRHRR